MADVGVDQVYDVSLQFTVVPKNREVMEGRQEQKREGQEGKEEKKGMSH